MHLELLGKPFYIEVISGDVEVPVTVSDKTASFLALEGNVTITYFTNDLTEKHGEEWTLQYMSNCVTYVKMPSEALIYSVSPESFEIFLENEELLLKFSPGIVNVKYVLVPSPTKETVVLTEETEGPSPIFPSTYYHYLYLFVGVLALVLLLYALYKYVLSSRKGLLEELDERDKLIINVLTKHGELSVQKIMEKTGIPKTPLYRRLKKLEKMGLIEPNVRSGKTYYRVKRK